MHSEIVRRPNAIEGILLRLRIALGKAPARPSCGTAHLSEHLRRDIGLQGFERGFDWWRFR